MTYLVSEYSTDDSLYPKDVRTRALVDQRIQFDLGTLYARMTDYFVSISNQMSQYETKQKNNRKF